LWYFHNQFAFFCWIRQNKNHINDVPTAAREQRSRSASLQHTDRKITMNPLTRLGFTAACAVCALPAAAQSPEAIAVPGETLIATFHAEGAQLYECKADGSGKLAWQFREPIATLLADGKTVGRHYAGPSWELADSSAVAGKVASRAPGASAADIPLLKLEVTAQRGTGQLTGVTTVQRLNTRGGTADGACATAGAFLSVPYSADYTFFRRGG
jgi:hypothetical protein